MDVGGEDIALDDAQISIAGAADDDDDDAVGTTAETSFGGIDDTTGATTNVTPAETPLMTSLEEEEIRKVVDTAYKKWNNDAAGPPLGGIHYDKFEWSPAGKYGIRARVLVLKDYPEVRIVSKTGDIVLALSSIANNKINPDGTGVAAIRDAMGYKDYGRTSQRFRRNMMALAALQKNRDDLGTISTEAETIDMQDLGAVAMRASSVVETTSSIMETTFSEADAPAPLPLREIRGLNKALQTIRGELVNNLAKLTELDNHITREQNKLDEPDIGQFERRRIAERLRNLKDERVSRLEAASASREALRSQISRIRETINRLINEDTTLAERIRTLFREQGITIASILTALGMVISTLVLAISGCGAAIVPTPPAPCKGGLREWVKKYLHALVRVLAKLAAKAGAALPGIIGSVVGWLLNLLSKTVGWLASNLWVLILAVEGILLM